SSGGCRASRFSEVVGGPNAFAPDLHTGLRLAAELRLAAVGVASGLAHPVEGGAEAALGAARGGTTILHLGRNAAPVDRAAEAEGGAEIERGTVGVALGAADPVEGAAAAV